MNPQEQAMLRFIQACLEDDQGINNRAFEALVHMLNESRPLSMNRGTFYLELEEIRQITRVIKGRYYLKA